MTIAEKNVNVQELISQNGKILKKQKKSDNKNEIKKIKREAMKTKKGWTIVYTVCICKCTDTVGLVWKNEFF